MALKIFSGSANKPLTEKVCKILGVSLSPLELYVFPDGEKRVRVEDRVVDDDTVVIQPTSHPADGNYMELFFIIDALKRSGSKSVTAVIPYLGYQRQDHIFRDGEAVSLDVVVRALETAGATRVITFDLHSIKIPELFSVPVVHLSALPLFAKQVESLKSKVESQDIVLVSPDMGGIRRIKLISEMLDNMPFATIMKNRDLVSGHVEAASIDGEVLKRAVIVDDMIASGKTVIAAAQLLRKSGAEDISVMAAHAVLSGNASELLQNSIISKVIVTDTIDIPDEKRFPKLEIISIADLIAKELRNL